MMTVCISLAINIQTYPRHIVTQHLLQLPIQHSDTDMRKGAEILMDCGNVMLTAFKSLNNMALLLILLNMFIQMQILMYFLYQLFN